MRVLAFHRRRRVVVPLTALLVAATLSGCLGWFSQLLTSDGSVLKGIACPSTAFCVAVGQTDPDGGTGFIEVTTDGGAHWASQTGGPLLSSVSCWDAQHCVAVGSGVVVTSDGGTSWTPASNPPNAELSSVSCPEADHCWAVGGRAVDSTTDGGMTWSNESWTAPAEIGGFAGGPYTFTGGNLRAIDCLSTSACVAVGGATYTWTNPPPETTLPPEVQFVTLDMTTDDGGQTWSVGVGENFPFAPGGLNAVSCPSTQQCLALGEESDASGSLQLTSTNGDATWSSSWTAHPGLFTANGLTCPDTRDCIAVATNPGGQYGSPVMSSSDGGNTWTPQAVRESSATLYSVACATENSCWAVGGTSAGAIVLHTLTGGHAWPEISGVSPDSGPATGGTTVVISGLQLDLGVTSISFGTATTTAFTVDSPTQITVTAPPIAEGSSQTVDVAVNSALGSSPPTPADQFTYLSSS